MPKQAPTKATAALSGAGQHYALELAREHRSEDFLDMELGLREARGFPPAGNLALFRIESVAQEQAWETARRVTSSLRQAAAAPGVEVDVQGPRLAPVERIKERWRIQILVGAQVRTELNRLLAQVVSGLDQEPPHHKVHVALDVDPHSFL